jgi:group I intron endonuclease
MADLYMLTSPSGKSYIGISDDARRRWNEHNFDARKGSKCVIHLAIRKHGWDNFKKQILVTSTYDYVRDLESKLIKAYKTMLPDGYNMTVGGEVSPMSNPEVAARVGRALKGRKNPVRGANVSGEGNPMFGKQHSDESKSEMRLKMLNRPKLECSKCGGLFRVNNLKTHTNRCEVKS